MKKPKTREQENSEHRKNGEHRENRNNRERKHRGNNRGRGRGRGGVVQGMCLLDIRFRFLLNLSQS